MAEVLVTFEDCHRKANGSIANMIEGTVANGHIVVKASRGRKTCQEWRAPPAPMEDWSLVACWRWRFEFFDE